MINAILLLADLKNANQFDWLSLIEVAVSSISLVAIVILLIERREKKRPYLQVSFELIKSNLVCLTIKNVGEVPAVLNAVKFSKEFIEQLPERGKKHVLDKSCLSLTFYPKQQWVICLEVIAPDVVNYNTTKLDVTLTYTPKGKRKKYNETELIDFLDYSDFLVYISEIDELKEELKKLTKEIKSIEKALNKMTLNNSTQVATQNYIMLRDHMKNTIVTERSNIEKNKSDD